jgi:hypothetical protein
MNRPIAALALAAVLLGACSSSSGSATPDPALAFCPALDAYGASLTALDNLDATATVDQYQAAVADAKAKLAALVPLAAPFAGQLTTLTTAQSQLEAVAVDLRSGTTTPAEAEAALDAPISAVVQQVVATHNALCNFRPTPSTAP